MYKLNHEAPFALCRTFIKCLEISEKYRNYKKLLQKTTTFAKLQKI